MVLDTLRTGKGLTESEREVARWLLAHGDELPDMKASELAAATLTSKGTVLRLCRKLGCESYADFKLAFAREWGDLARVRDLIKKEPFDEDSSVEDIIDELPNIYERILVRTKLMLDPKTLAEAVRLLVEADKIELYGAGISYTIAQMGAFKFLTLGKEAVALSGLNERYPLRVPEGFRRCGIVISLTGANVGMLSIARSLRETGCPVIGIGGLSRGPALKNESDVYIPYSTQRSTLTLEASEGVLGCNYILDVLFSALMVRDYQANLDAALRFYGVEETPTE